MKVKSVQRGTQAEKRYSIPTVARAIHKSETQIHSFMGQTYGSTKGGLTYEMIKEAIDYEYRTQPRISWEGIEEIKHRLKEDGYIFSETETNTLTEESVDEEE